ncbi:hypothetical protein HOY80DRAFT_991779 [Tuber brumale]|nr:hypothetical protein HOY80DRAFT_991779 [Tuber brumale]
MSLNRSLPRNVSFYDATNPDEVLGGLVQNGSITEANFLDMLGILLVIGVSPIRVQERRSSHIVSRTEVPLQVGVYDIYCEASIQVSDEPWVHRLISHKIASGENSFRDDIRNRDRKCVISGISNPEISIQSNNWTTFEAVHIFPPERSSLWIQYDYGRWIAGKDGATESSKINSPGNGLLLELNVQQMFDQYLISVNPDDGYKVVVFYPDLFGYDGKTLDPVCRNPADPRSVSDELLRWHFRQSVLANVRGAGEPIFEHDFPPGTDMMGEILAGPYARERFELEIAARLEEVA